MPNKTRAQIQEQMAALQAELDGADTDDEIWIQEGDGPAIRVTGRRATKALEKYAHLWPEDDGGDGDPEPDPEPEGAGLFKRRGGK